MTQSQQWPSAPCTLQALLEQATDNFAAADLYFGHGTDNAWDEAVALALHGLGLGWDADVSILEWVLSEEQVRTIVSLCERRIDERIPAPYLTGKAFFAGLEFRVTPDVLIPRSPIAELIETAYSPWLPKEPETILDLCAGSGCIGIASAAVMPDARVDLSDISPEAVQVAEDNIRLHGLGDQVQAFTGDMFAALGDRRYDLIVCNPPYVDAEDLASMPAEYQAEPSIALGSGTDGLDFCRRLLREAGEHLTEQGCLIVELGNSWEALERAFPRVPFVWLEFERGGHGVFVMTAGELARYRPEFG
ncbi:50S ribosomal protein L3 N(5)-glutamine methyltransferase [Proteobacteria bacterium 005FR1]|nr:50S ribosomal protein L3 N(5)-glutamine methyltransferase [Proteobacteria bacterium 005FR1]